MNCWSGAWRELGGILVSLKNGSQGEGQGVRTIHGGKHGFSAASARGLGLAWVKQLCNKVRVLHVACAVLRVCPFHTHAWIAPQALSVCLACGLLTQDPSFYDESEKLWVWKYDGNDMYMDLQVFVLGVGYSARVWASLMRGAQVCGGGQRHVHRPAGCGIVVSKRSVCMA